VKNEGLKPLHDKAKARYADFAHVAITHVPREKNARADQLVNEALDDAARSSL
jgi:ribonuclease HI